MSQSAETEFCRGDRPIALRDLIACIRREAAIATAWQRLALEAVKKRISEGGFSNPPRGHECPRS